MGEFPDCVACKPLCHLRQLGVGQAGLSLAKV
jgi:hypothetical protein